MVERNKISNRIKELRAKFNMTQEDLAQKVGVTRQTIISIEKNEYVPSLLLGMRIAQTFKLPVEEIFIANF
ncbi:MAG: helix-turn-helix transcriptional regulator [Candidatus Kerfeldbacteria bacterium]|nr:helix-turn-helix transcriptional regulator [Candidatus Kerfeldbacteria bacterium]